MLEHYQQILRVSVIFLRNSISDWEKKKFNIREYQLYDKQMY